MPGRPSPTRPTPQRSPSPSAAADGVSRTRRPPRRVPRGDAPAARRVRLEAGADPPVAGALPARGDPRDARGDRHRRCRAPARGARRPAAAGLLPRRDRRGGRGVHPRRRRRRHHRQDAAPQPARLRSRRGDWRPRGRPRASTRSGSRSRPPRSSATSVTDGLPPGLPRCSTPTRCSTASSARAEPAGASVGRATSATGCSPSWPRRGRPGWTRSRRCATPYDACSEHAVCPGGCGRYHLSTRPGVISRR